MLNELDEPTAQSVPWRVAEAYAAEVELERSRWKAITAFVELLRADERLAPGYYHDPDWSVKDLIAHLGAWMAEARVQLLDIAARSYVPHEVDVTASVGRQWRPAGRARSGHSGWQCHARPGPRGQHRPAM